MDAAAPAALIPPGNQHGDHRVPFPQSSRKSRTIRTSNARINRKLPDLRELFLQAGGRGFEPRQANPESAVLPLDEPPIPGNERHSTMFAIPRQTNMAIGCMFNEE